MLPVSALAVYITRSSAGLVPYGVALTYGGGTLWAGGQCGSSACVLAIDPARNTIVKAWTVPLPEPASLAYGDRSLWVAGGNSVLRIDPAPNASTERAAETVKRTDATATTSRRPAQGAIVAPLPKRDIVCGRE